MSEWKETAIGEICTLNDSNLLGSESLDYAHYLDTGNITSGDIQNIQRIDLSAGETLPSRAKRKVCDGDIVFSTVRPNQRHYGIIVNQPENFLVSTGFSTIRANPDKAENRFIYYFLTRDSVIELLQTIAEQSVSAYPSIKPSDIEKLSISLPPLPVQKRIAEILGSLDEKIELNRRTSATLEQMAQALFRSWFVDFDPVKAKAAGKRPKGLSPEVARLFPKEFDDSPLGPIPKGWCVGSLKDIVNYSNGKKRPLEEGTIPVYGGNGIMEYTSRSNYEDVVIVGRVGAYCGCVYYEPLPCWVSDNAIAATGNNEFGIAFIYYLLKHLKLNEKSVGTSQPLLTQGILNSLSIVVPDIFLVRNFSEIVQSLTCSIRQKENETRTLSALRDTLLPKLMSGELEV